MKSRLGIAIGRQMWTMADVMKRLAFLLASISIPFVTGCGDKKGDDSTGSSGSGKKVIAYSMMTSQNPFFLVIEKHMKAEAEKHGYELIAVSGDEDADKQHNQVREFISKKVAAIVLSPCKSKLIGPAIKEANDAGIPVFTCDNKSLSPEGKVVCHIATDNYQGGKLGGEAILELVGETGGKVLVLHYRRAESCILRVKGFNEVIDAHNAAGKPKITVIELEGGGKREIGEKATAEALQSHKDLAAIFAINDPSGLGAYQALVREKKQDQVKIVAFDGAREGKLAIKEGKIYADPIQFPDKMGVMTVQKIIAYFNGETVEEEILIPSALYRKADAEKDPELQ